MNIERIDTARILVLLGEKDLEEYEITFESLTFSEMHSKEVLTDIIRSASEKAGIDFRNKKIVIEALKYDKGCMLLLTLSKKRKIYRVRYYSKTYIFKFDSAESFLSCIKAVYRLKEEKMMSSAFLYNGMYYLVINTSSGLKEIYMNTFSEFCTGYSRGELYRAFLKEHGKPLKLHNAVKSIGSIL